MNIFARAAASEHLRPKRRVDSLAAIATAAPFAGLFGTCIGIVSTFRGTSGNRDSIMAAICISLAEALIPTAAGLAIGLAALSFHRVLTAQHARLAIPAAAAPPPPGRR